MEVVCFQDVVDGNLMLRAVRLRVVILIDSIHSFDHSFDWFLGRFNGKMGTTHLCELEQANPGMFGYIHDSFHGNGNEPVSKGHYNGHLLTQKRFSFFQLL